MHVGVVLEQLLAPVPGGTGRYAREVARALARSVSASDRVSRVTGWTAWHRDAAGARVADVSGPRRLPLGRRALAAAWERGFGPDLRGVDVTVAPTLLVPPTSRRPVIVTIHDAVPWTHPETLTPRGVAFHRRMAERAARSAVAIVVPTDAVRRELQRFLECAAPMEVVGEGVTETLAVPPDVDMRAARLDLPAGGYFVSVATLEPRKGLDVALAALARPEAPDLPLLLVGRPGWGGVDPAAEAVRLGIPAEQVWERVRILGSLSDADLAVAVSRATALVAPSRSEGFGLPVLEAMALGTPVISSDAPALLEVGAGATRPVPVGDPAELARALAEVASDPALQERMRVAGLRRACDFSWETTGRRLWDLCEQAVPSRR